MQRKDIYDMVQQLERLPNINWVHTALTIKKPRKDGYGLHGSGMFIINPPYTLHPALEKTMPYLTTHLAEDEHARFVLNHHEK